MNKLQQPVLTLREVGKRFPLYGSSVRQMLGYFGFGSKNVKFKQALKNIDLTILHGERVGIIGHNGSGKTTLLRLVSGFTKPTSGNIFVNGSVQALMQKGYAFNDELSGLENVRNALVYNGLDGESLVAAEEDILDFVELEDFIKHPVKTYSLGMRMRLEFAAATAINPDVLVIDEVLGAGDGYFVQKSAMRMRKLIEHSTLLLVSHSLDQIREYCERVIWIDGGVIREDGPVEAVIKNYRHHMSAQNTSIKSEGLSPAQQMISQVKYSELIRKIIEQLGASIAADEISHFSFSGSVYKALSIETGDPLSLELNLNLSQPLQPVILGFTADGGFVFEMQYEEILDVGTHRLTLCLPKTPIGVGNYVLVPAVRGDYKGADNCLIGQDFLELQMAVTNWSDPPLLHFDAKWRSGPFQKEISSKVNAWV